MSKDKDHNAHGVKSLTSSCIAVVNVLVYVYSFDFNDRVDYIAVGFLCKLTGSKHSHETFSFSAFTRHTILLPYIVTNKHTTVEQFKRDKDKKNCNFH